AVPVLLPGSQALRSRRGEPGARSTAGRREGLMGRFSRLGNDLFTGRKSIDFVGRRRLWYAMSGVIIIAAILGLYFRGLNYGNGFVGGAEFTVPVPPSEVTQANADKLSSAVSGTGIPAAEQVTATTAGQSSILVETKPLTPQETLQITSTIEQTMGVTKADI